MIKRANKIWFQLLGGKENKPLPISPMVVICLTSDGSTLSPYLATASEIEYFVNTLQADLEALRTTAIRALEDAK